MNLQVETSPASVNFNQVALRYRIPTKETGSRRWFLAID